MSGFIALYYFLCHREVRVITTSIKDDHLRVLWGEINRFISTAKYPLRCQRKRDDMMGFTLKMGGPLWVNHRDIRKYVNGKLCNISYLLGTVSERGEGLQGHHAEHTLGIIDEASGVSDEAYNAITSWAKKILVIGNPLPSSNNFFERAAKAGDLLAEEI